MNTYAIIFVALGSGSTRAWHSTQTVTTSIPAAERWRDGIVGIQAVRYRAQALAAREGSQHSARWRAKQVLVDIGLIKLNKALSPKHEQSCAIGASMRKTCA